MLCSLLPRLPLQLLRPVQPSVQVETHGGALVGLEGVMELVSLQYLIYYNIKLFFKGSHQSPRHHGHNKFQLITDLPIAPLSIPAWSNALAVVNDDPSHVDERYRSPNDRKYVFPAPGIFLGANEVRRAKYFLTWQAIEPVCIHRLLTSTAPPLSNQEW